MDKVVIIIISHKSELNIHEQISLRQCYKVLGSYPIKIICPYGLDVSGYKEFLPNPQFDFIDPVWQSTYENFNRLKVEQFLYERYKKYQFILFYEPDVFVFRNELEYWCNQNLDYIGAPWFEDWNKSTAENNIKGVGNGGFSLRNVSGILNQHKLLKRLKIIYKYENYDWKGLMLRTLRIFADIVKYKSFEPVFELSNGQEDFFWCIDMPDLFEKYINNNSFVAKLFKLSPIQKLKIADITTAMKFSMECQPARLFAMNKNNLPFGCQAWPKYDIEFWKPFIISAGYDLPLNSKHK